MPLQSLFHRLRRPENLRHNHRLFKGGKVAQAEGEVLMPGRSRRCRHRSSRRRFDAGSGGGIRLGGESRQLWRRRWNARLGLRRRGGQPVSEVTVIVLKVNRDVGLSGFGRRVTLVPRAHDDAANDNRHRDENND